QPRPAASSTLSASGQPARCFVRALGPLGDEIPRPFFLKTEPTRLAHAARAGRVAEKGEDRARDRVRLLRDDEAIDPVAHHFAERRDVAGDDGPPRVPGLEVCMAERLVHRWHGEDRRAGVGLGLLGFAHDPAVDQAIVFEASLEPRCPVDLAVRDEPLLWARPPYALRGLSTRVYSLVTLHSAS